VLAFGCGLCHWLGLRVGWLLFNLLLLVGIGEGLSSLSVCLVGKCADCGAIRGDLRGFYGLSLVLGCSCGGKGCNGLKIGLGG